MSEHGSMEDAPRIYLQTACEPAIRDLRDAYPDERSLAVDLLSVHEHDATLLREQEPIGPRR